VIFQHTWQAILEGRKTQTRRPVKPHQMLLPVTPYSAEMCVVQSNVPAKTARVYYREGATYAVQPGRGKKGVARIRITRIRYVERAAEISAVDSAAEGFLTGAEFRRVYGTINGSGSLGQPCWALTFELVPNA
jgi:hypothetical protein